MHHLWKMTVNYKKVKNICFI